MTAMAAKTVQELAVEIPGAENIFQQFGLDYYSEQPLAEACAIAGVPVEKVLQELGAFTNDPGQSFQIQQDVLEDDYGDCSSCTAHCPSAGGRWYR